MGSNVVPSSCTRILGSDACVGIRSSGVVLLESVSGSAVRLACFLRIFRVASAFASSNYEAREYQRDVVAKNKIK